MRTIYPQTASEFDVEQVLKLHFSHPALYINQEYNGDDVFEVVAPSLNNEEWEDTRPFIYVTSPWGTTYELEPQVRKGRACYVLRYEYQDGPEVHRKD